MPSLKELIIKGINLACIDLKKYDGALFECPIEPESEVDARKLHEVCINHRFSNHLEKYLTEDLEKEIVEKIYFDIEFNREGEKPKYVKGKLYRPDIIVHNRKSGEEKKNILIVECKKADASCSDIENDRSKIVDFMTDEKYLYQYGLQIIYGEPIKSYFFFKEDDRICCEELKCQI